MAYGLPDNLWIFLLIMAAIILALLWKDKISKGSGGGGGGGGTETTPDGPKITSLVHRPVNPDPGEDVNFRAEYKTNASIRSYWIKVDGNKLDTSKSGGSLTAGPVSRDEGTYEYSAFVKDKNGKSHSIGSSFSVSTGETLEGPILGVEENFGDDTVELVAQAEPRSANSISRTAIEVEGVGESEERGPQASIELPANPGQTYNYTAVAVDSNGIDARVSGQVTIPDNPSPISVKADYDIIDHGEGKVKIWAEVVEYSADIEKTRIQYRPRGAGEDAWVTKDVENSIRAEIDETGLSDGFYEFRGAARDINQNRATDSGVFEIGVSEGPGGSMDDLPEGVQGIFQNTNNNFSGLPPQYLEVIKDIIDETGGRDQTGDVTQQVGMDAYQLLLALSTLETDLDGDDNSQILAELRAIRQEVGQDQMSPSELENSIRNVMHDVFGQDIQGVIQGLDLGDGFDEQAIVQAIESKDVDVDLSEVTDRLDNIEQAVTQVQSQGGDLTDVERKLDDIESAVRDLQVDDQIFQNLTAELEALRNEGVQVNMEMNDPLIIKLVEDIQHSGNPQMERQRILQAIKQEGILTRQVLMRLLGEDDDNESGGEGNKNEEEDDSSMASEGQQIKKFDKQELKSLEEDIDALSNFVQDFDDLNFNEARKLKNEIEDKVQNVEQELSDVHEQAELFSRLVDDINDWSEGGKSKEEIIKEIEDTHKHENKIREELKDIHGKMSDIRREVKRVEELCNQFNEVLGASENEFSSTVDSITDDFHQLEDLIKHVNEYTQSFREESAQYDTHNPSQSLGQSPR